MTEAQKLSNLKNEVDGILAQSGVGSSVSTNIEEQEFVITFADSVFDSGQATIRPEIEKHN